MGLCILACLNNAPCACFGVKLAGTELCLPPQTGNVSATIDVKSGHIVGKLTVGR